MTTAQLKILATAEARAYRAYRDAAQKGAADKEWATWIAVEGVIVALESTMTQKERDLIDDHKEMSSVEFATN